MQLLEFRKLRRLSRAALGRELGGVAGVTVWRWETGRAIPQPRMIARIREYSGGAVTADDHHQAAEAYRAGAVECAA